MKYVIVRSPVSPRNPLRMESADTDFITASEFPGTRFSTDSFIQGTTWFNCGIAATRRCWLKAGSLSPRIVWCLECVYRIVKSLRRQVLTIRCTRFGSDLECRRPIRRGQVRSKPRTSHALTYTRTGKWRDRGGSRRTIRILIRLLEASELRGWSLSQTTCSRGANTGGSIFV